MKLFLKDPLSGKEKVKFPPENFKFFTVSVLNEL
jgi:hypothetical protein